jgi:hypothetical protein
MKNLSLTGFLFVVFLSICYNVKLNTSYLNGAFSMEVISMKCQIMSAILMIALVFMVGCSSQNSTLMKEGMNETEHEKNDIENQAIKEQALVDENLLYGINEILDEKRPIEDVLDFVDENVSRLSKENVAFFIQAVLDVQKLHLNDIDREFFENEVIQEELLSRPEILDHSDFTENRELIQLLEKTKSLGYKIIQEGGQFIPIIDYSFLEKYKPYMAEDMKEFIDILVVESDQVPVLDMGLVITWDEVLQRTLRQEAFLRTHPNSLGYEEIQKLYEKYVNFSLFGAIHTPIFHYESKKMDSFAKNKYFEFIANHDKTNFISMISDYYNIILSNDLRLTEEVVEFLHNNKMNDYPDRFGDLYIKGE